MGGAMSWYQHKERKVSGNLSTDRWSHPIDGSFSADGTDAVVFWRTATISVSPGVHPAPQSKVSVCWNWGCQFWRTIRVFLCSTGLPAEYRLTWEREKAKFVTNLKEFVQIKKKQNKESWLHIIYEYNNYKEQHFISTK